MVTDFVDLDDEAKAKRIVAARAVLKEAIRLTNLDEVANLILTQAGRRST